MPIDINFSLTEQDLDYFRQRLETSRQHIAGIDESDVIARAQEVLDRLDREKLPDFFLRRLESLGLLIRMLEDSQWSLSPQERADIVGALAYLYEPADAIADEIPALGLLDDAIIIELVLGELQYGVEAYAEFCKFRDISEQLGQPGVSREAWLADKKHQLYERMRQRMQRHQREAHAGGRLTAFSLS
jgi:uncharacterized membrane protein YkvA (DUF1232 family)